MGSIPLFSLKSTIKSVEIPEMVRRNKSKKYGKARTSYRRRRFSGRRSYRSKKAILKRRSLYKKTHTVPEVKTVVTDCRDRETPYKVARDLDSGGLFSGHVTILYDPAATNDSGNTFFPNISSGTYKTQRIGNKIVPTSSVIKFRFKGQSEQVNSMKYEIIIFKKVRDTTDNFAIGDFIHPDSFDGGVKYTPNCDRVQSSFRNYIVLYRKLFHCPSDEYAGQNWVKDHKIIIRHKGPVVYDESAGNISSQIQYGDIGCLVTCNGGSVGDNTGLEFRFNHRLYFVDP